MQPSIRWKGCAGGAVRASASSGESMNASNTLAGETRTIQLILTVCLRYSERELSYREFCSPIKEPIQYCFQANFLADEFA